MRKLQTSVFFLVFITVDVILLMYKHTCDTVLFNVNIKRQIFGLRNYAIIILTFLKRFTTLF